MKILLQTSGLLHFAILAASALVPKVFDWRRNLASLDPFLRQLFWVYGAFIVLTIIGFGTISVTFADRLAAGDPLGKALCGMIGAFWLARLCVQLFVFDCAAFLTNGWLRAGYHGLTVCFVFFTAVYGGAALGMKEALP